MHWNFRAHSKAIPMVKSSTAKASEQTGGWMNGKARGIYYIIQCVGWVQLCVILCDITEGLGCLMFPHKNGCTQPEIRLWRLWLNHRMPPFLCSPCCLNLKWSEQVEKGCRKLNAGLMGNGWHQHQMSMFRGFTVPKRDWNAVWSSDHRKGDAKPQMQSINKLTGGKYHDIAPLFSLEPGGLAMCSAVKHSRYWGRSTHTSVCNCADQCKCHTCVCKAFN